MAMELACEFQRIADDEAGALLCQHTGIANLAARFGIERSAIQDHHGILTSLDDIDRASVLEQGRHLQATGIQGVVA